MPKPIPIPQPQPQPRPRPRKFTPEEDAMLQQLVLSCGPDWVNISTQMDRTPREVRTRYVNFLSPDSPRSSWSKEEDQLLLEKVVEYGKRWTKLTAFFQGRDHEQLKNRYNLLQRWYSGESEFLRMKKRDLRSGSLYYWINDPSQPKMSGTRTNATTRAYVRNAKVPEAIRITVNSKKISKTSIYENTLAPGQNPDAGHIMACQNGGYGDQINCVFPQNPQINRGNILNGKSTYKEWKGLEDLIKQLTMDGVQVEVAVKQYFKNIL